MLGWCNEIVFTAITGFANNRDWRLAGKSYLWMFPIYALIGPLYEPMHDLIRAYPVFVRFSVWALGFTVVELITGWSIARMIGRSPWDYSSSRFAINSYIRWDYIPLWGIAGLLLEPVHDFLLYLTPLVATYLGRPKT